LSDTGELLRSWGHGTYTIDTPRTQAAMGQIGGKNILLSDVDIAVTTRNATVTVQSLNENPLSKSHSILISLGTSSNPKSAKKLPFYSEPVEGQLTVRAPKGLKLYRTNDSPSNEMEIPVRYEAGRYLIELGRILQTHWLFLK